MFADLIASYGYVGIVAIIGLESAGLPLPGETVLISAAAYAGSTGHLDIGLVVAVAALAAIVGDNLGYWAGRQWGMPLLLRYGSVLSLNPGRLRVGQYLFQQHGGKIVFFGRFTALLRAYAALLAGVNKLDARRFMVFNATGGLCWATVIGYGAYWCGRSIEHVAGPVGIALLSIVIVGGIALWRFFRRHETRLLSLAEDACPGPLN